MNALFLLKDYCFYVDTSVGLSGMLSNCIFRLVRAICCILNFNRLPKSQMRQTLFPIIHLLLQCLVLPGYSKCVRFKMDIYGSILSIFDVCNKVQATENELSSSKFESITEEVVSTIASDITFAPLSLKIVATSCLSDIIREDIVQSQQVAQHFVFSGSMRCVLDSLSRVISDFRNDKKTKQDAERKQKQLLLIKALFSLFVRLAASECGWTALVDGKMLQRICNEENESASRSTLESSPESIMRQLLQTMTRL